MIMPYEFNELYTRAADKSGAELQARVEAFLRLAYWLDDPNLRILRQGKTPIAGDGYTLNHRALIVKKRTTGSSDTLQLKLRINNKEIKEVTEYRGLQPVGKILPAQLSVPGQISTTGQERYVGEETMRGPLLERVFPGVHFIKEKYIGGCIATFESYKNIAWYHGQKLIMPWDFNILFAKIADISPANLDEFVDAYFLLCNPWGPKCEIIQRGMADVATAYRRFNYQMIVTPDPENTDTVQVRLLLKLNPYEILDGTIGSRKGSGIIWELTRITKTFGGEFDQVSRTESIQESVFRRVFPGAKFIRETGIPREHPARRVVAHFKGEKYEMPDDLNFLYVDSNKRGAATLNDRVESFIRLFYLRWGMDAKIEKQNEVKIERNGHIFNHHTIFKIIKNQTTDENPREWWIWLNDEEIIMIGYEDQYGWSEQRPVNLINEPPDLKLH